MVYPHPYQYELDNYLPEERFLEKAEVQVSEWWINKDPANFLDQME